MVRLTIEHINKFGPLQLPATHSQVFIEDSRVPKDCLTGFYQRCIEVWLKENPERQLFNWHKDIVGEDAIPDGSKNYTPTSEAKGEMREEEL